MIKRFGGLYGGGAYKASSLSANYSRSQRFASEEPAVIGLRLGHKF